MAETAQMVSRRKRRTASSRAPSVDLCGIPPAVCAPPAAIDLVEAGSAERRLAQEKALHIAGLVPAPGLALNIAHQEEV